MCVTDPGMCITYQGMCRDYKEMCMIYQGMCIIWIQVAENWNIETSFNSFKYFSEYTRCLFAGTLQVGTLAYV